MPEALNNQLGIAVAKRTYKAYLDLLSSPRWMRAYNAGARPQRLLWASTGTKDPKASTILYIKALAAPFTVNTMPEGTLKALADPGGVGVDDAGGRRRLRRGAGAVRRGQRSTSMRWRPSLQDEGAKSFVNSWNDLMGVIGSKSAALKRAS